MKLREYIDTHLQIGWSPSEVAGSIAKGLGLTRGIESTSKTAIYEYLRSVHGELLSMEIGLQKIRKRKKKDALKQQTSVMKLADRIFIDERPTSIDERLHF